MSKSSPLTSRPHCKGALRELRRRKMKLGLVSMCVGKGMGAAGLFEAC